LVANCWKILISGVTYLNFEAREAFKICQHLALPPRHRLDHYYNDSFQALFICYLDSIFVIAYKATRQYLLHFHLGFSLHSDYVEHLIALIVEALLLNKLC
jgi:hypothetical protein